MKKYLTMQECVDMVARLTPIGLLDKEAVYCYGMSKMTVQDESVDLNMKYQRIQYVEFLEFIARVAVVKCKGTQIEALPLARKIEFVLDQLLTLVGEKRRTVSLDKENEQSESDDEY